MCAAANWPAPPKMNYPAASGRGLFEIATAFGLEMTHWVVIANEVKQSQFFI
jgi:hypothetical protein